MATLGKEGVEPNVQDSEADLHEGKRSRSYYKPHKREWELLTMNDGHRYHC